MKSRGDRAGCVGDPGSGGDSWVALGQVGWHRGHVCLSRGQGDSVGLRGCPFPGTAPTRTGEGVPTLGAPVGRCGDTPEIRGMPRVSLPAVSPPHGDIGAAGTVPAPHRGGRSPCHFVPKPPLSPRASAVTFVPSLPATGGVWMSPPCDSPPLVPNRVAPVPPEPSWPCPATRRVCCQQRPPAGDSCPGHLAQRQPLARCHPRVPLPGKTLEIPSRFCRVCHPRGTRLSPCPQLNPRHPHPGGDNMPSLSPRRVPAPQNVPGGDSRGGRKDRARWHSWGGPGGDIRRGGDTPGKWGRGSTGLWVPELTGVRGSPSSGSQFGVPLKGNGSGSQYGIPV